MKKIVVGLAVASTVLLADSFAQLGLGYSRGDNANSFVTGFGSLDLLGNIGMRLEYTKNMTENPEFSKEDISRYGLFATYTLPLLAQVSLTPKVGLVKTDGAFTPKGTFRTLSDSATEFTYGLEVNYDINQKVSAFVGYTDYGNHLEVKHIDTSKMDTSSFTFGLKVNL